MLRSNTMMARPSQKGKAIQHLIPEKKKKRVIPIARHRRKKKGGFSYRGRGGRTLSFHGLKGEKRAISSDRVAIRKKGEEAAFAAIEREGGDG